MPPNPLLTRRGPSCRDTVATDGDVARAGSLYASLFHDHGFCLYYHHMNPAAREVLHNKYHPVLEQAGASHGVPSYEVGLRRCRKGHRRSTA